MHFLGEPAVRTLDVLYITHIQDKNTKCTMYPFTVNRKYTNRVVTTSRLKAPRHLVVHDNLKTFTKYSKRSVLKPLSLSQ